ncbi:MAG: hypothetical protein WBD40_09690 [Tepidisphaeraceae bacterium]
MTNVLLDTNLLLLLIIGSWDRSSVSRFKRTSQFDEADFDLLVREIGRYGQVVTTPSILTESSNLIRDDAHVRIAPSMVRLYATLVERWTGKSQVTADRSFSRLGYCDAMVLTVAQEGTAVLTDDLDLYMELSYRNQAVTNFNHLRSQHNG